MAHNPDSDQHKRKRDVIDDNGSQAHADRIPQPPPPQSGKSHHISHLLVDHCPCWEYAALRFSQFYEIQHPHSCLNLFLCGCLGIFREKKIALFYFHRNAIPINYLSKTHATKLKLIQGDSDTFSDVLTLVSEYEGVLNRHESLAFNLGAKLTGARLLKAMEGAFEGAITTTPPQNMFTPDPVTWLDIVEFAKANPGEFSLSATPSGMRCCHFPLKGVQVEIGEDDWRLIVSGALDRFRLVPPQPLEEDETAEMATLEILDQRLQVLIKRADEVARRARQLNYHLSGRRASIHARRSSQAASGSGFQPVNSARPTGASPGYDLHADLLQQFLVPSQSSAPRLSSVSSVPPTPNTMVTASSTPRTSIQQPSLLASNRPSPGYASEPTVKDVEEENRTLATARIDKLTRGNAIQPPCDRCRRLKTQCIKHLTACQGCTKKHTKCTWKKLTDEEVAWLKGENSGEGDDDEDEPSQPSSRSSFPAGYSVSGPSELKSDSERGEDPGASRLGLRIAVGRHVDDIWRKGPATPSTSRDDIMEVDPRDTRRGQYSTEQGGYGTSVPSVDAMMRHVASLASARADAATTPREGQHGR
ncbi:hypothetical protein F5Y15DRAFT_83470 [Xylariaceae sp. FL0016]|nr:hypothetical protein F5Y15DRAFT_83470 [Xylariaceae sp. FL0016]